MNENTNQAVETTEVTAVEETAEKAGFVQRHKKGLIAAGLAVAGLVAYKLIKGRKAKSSDEEVIDGDYYEVDADDEE